MGKSLCVVCGEYEVGASPFYCNSPKCRRIYREQKRALDKASRKSSRKIKMMAERVVAPSKWQADIAGQVRQIMDDYGSTESEAVWAVAQRTRTPVAEVLHAWRSTTTSA